MIGRARDRCRGFWAAGGRAQVRRERSEGGGRASPKHTRADGRTKWWVGGWWGSGWWGSGRCGAGRYGGGGIRRWRNGRRQGGELRDRPVNVGRNGGGGVHGGRGVHNSRGRGVNGDAAITARGRVSRWTPPRWNPRGMLSRIRRGILRDADVDTGKWHAAGDGDGSFGGGCGGAARHVWRAADVWRAIRCLLAEETADGRER